jgi:hypothetical protein
LFKTNSEVSEYQSRLASRSLYATNAVVFVLMPPARNESPATHLRDLQTRFAHLLQAIESHCSHFMFVSFLRDETQTRHAILQTLLASSQQQPHVSYTYCHLDSRSSDYVKNNATLIFTYQRFLREVCAALGNSTQQHSRRHLDGVRANVACLSDIYYNTVMRFVDSMAAVSCSSGHGCTLSSAVREYNAALSRLVDVLANEEYKRLAWPVPELVDGGERWTLTYWNTGECLDGVLRGQFCQLMSLGEVSGGDDDEDSEFDSAADDDEDDLVVESGDEENSWRVVGYERLERLVFDYLDRVLRAKIEKKVVKHEESESEGEGHKQSVIAIYKLENMIRINLNSLKKGMFDIKKKD